MSGSTAQPPAHASTSTDSFLKQCHKLTTASVRTVAFWGAVCMPLVVIAALYEGIANNRGGLFLSLLVVNLVCVVVGHSYSPDQ